MRVRRAGGAAKVHNGRYPGGYLREEDPQRRAANASGGCAAPRKRRTLTSEAGRSRSESPYPPQVCDGSEARSHGSGASWVNPSPLTDRYLAPDPPLPYPSAQGGDRAGELPGPLSEVLDEARSLRLQPALPASAACPRSTAEPARCPRGLSRSSSDTSTSSPQPGHENGTGSVSASSRRRRSILRRQYARTSSNVWSKGAPARRPTSGVSRAPQRERRSGPGTTGAGTTTSRVGV